MREFVKKGFLLGLGAASIAKRKAEKAVNEIVRKKAISKKDGQKILRAVKNYAETESKRIAMFAEQEVGRIAKQIGIASKNKSQKAKKMLKKMDSKLTAEGKRTLRKIIKELE